MSSKQFLEYILDLLTTLGEFKSRAMFGGYGIYNHGLIIAIIIDDELYFKGDKETQNYYTSFGSEQFTYDGKNAQKICMPYWKAPPDVLEQPEFLAKWVDVAYQVSFKSKKNKK
jgi:DNA transformation protein